MINIIFTNHQRRLPENDHQRQLVVTLTIGKKKREVIGSESKGLFLG